MGTSRWNAKIARACAAICTIAVAAPPASAAETRDSGVDTGQLRPGAGVGDYLHALGGFTGRHMGFDVGAIVHVADAPLLTERGGSGDKTPLLGSQSVLDLLVAWSAFDRLEVGLHLPIVVDQTLGAGFDTSRGLVAPGSAAGVGDLRLLPKVRLLDPGPGFSLALAAPLSLPTGSDFKGYGQVAVQPTLIVDVAPATYFRMTLNAGARLRGDARFDDLALGHEIVWAAGFKASFFIADQPFSIISTFHGAHPLDLPAADDPPIEFLAGLEWRGIPNTAVAVAGGAGLTRGYGAPDSRVLFSIRYGSYDDCPHGPEDLDGFEDDDGCADPDNDGDGVPDVDDLCPNEPETFNGFDDEDGCPDERYPHDVDLDALRTDGHDPYGSATADADGDGIPDADDACPLEPEDHDGFEDLDGCPDPDNDGDGISDVDDDCPLQAETFNGFEDEDGCPDDVPTRATVDDLSQRITITERVYFATGRATLRERSFPLLDEVAALMEAREDLRVVRVEGHTDSTGAAGLNQRLSRARAEAVRDYLIDRGVAAERLVAEGYGESQPVASNATEAGRQDNRRVDFVIVESGRALDPSGDDR